MIFYQPLQRFARLCIAGEHLVLLEQALDTASQALDRLALLLHHLAEIDAQVVAVDAMVCEVRARIVVLVAVLQQRLHASDWHLAHDSVVLRSNERGENNLNLIG